MRDAIFVLLLRWELLQVQYSKINFFSLSNDDLNITLQKFSKLSAMLYLLICLHFGVIWGMNKQNVVVFDPNLPHFY